MKIQKLTKKETRKKWKISKKDENTKINKEGDKEKMESKIRK